MSGLYEHLDPMVTASCDDLVPPCTAQRVPVDDEQGVMELAAVVGFSGESVRGTLGLTATLPALSVTHPSTIAGVPTDPRMLEDWVGELANQVMGRIKAQFRRRGIVVWMSTPVVLRGVSIVVTSHQDHVRRYAFSMRGEAGFALWLDVDADEGLAVSAADLSGGPSPGEVVLL